MASASSANVSYEKPPMFIRASFLKALIAPGKIKIALVSLCALLVV